MLTTYILGCLALIIKPGPDLTCTLATALSEGRRNACVLMMGLILGCWFWIILLTLGVASFFVAHPMVMTVIQIVGVCYISYLAVMSILEAYHGFRGKGSNVFHPATARGFALIRRGVAMSMSNPLTILFFLAFLPNFTQEGSTFSPPVQTFLLGTLFCLLVPWIYMPIIFAADALRSKLLGSSGFSIGLKLFSGLMLVGVAIYLALQV